MKHLLVTASTLALGLGLVTPVLAESDCAYPPCVQPPAGTLLPGAGPSDGTTDPARGEREESLPTAPAPGPAPDSTPPGDDCGDGCGDDSAMGSGGDTVFLTLAELQDLGVV